MKACFIGHRTVENQEELLGLLKETVISLLAAGVTVFLFGSMSDFDRLSRQVVSELKKEYPAIRRVYVRAAFQHIGEDYERHLLESCEETYFPAKLERAGRSSYVERNYEMIDHADYCVFYYNKEYLPPEKRARKTELLPPKKRNSGTKIAYDYAVKKKKEIINLYK